MEFFMIETVNKLNAAQNLENNNVQFICEPNLAQYKGSDYSNAVRVERGITLEEAKQIAANCAEIDYFVYVKGGMMVLEFPPEVPFPANGDPLHLVRYTPFMFDDGRPGQGYCRVFTHGDVVFFKNEGKWLGTAPGLADVYSKKQ